MPTMSSSTTNSTTGQMAKQEPAAAGMPGKPKASSTSGEDGAATFSCEGVHGDLEAFQKFMSEHMGSILRASQQSNGEGANDDDEQVDSSEYEVCCAGLDPVLEAVDELPLGGTPIPASAQKRVEQFLVNQINSGPPAVISSGSLGPAAKPPCVRPMELQDTKQLREFLQKHVETAWVSVASTGLTPVVTAAVQLVAESAHRVARQQVIEKKSQAYTILLDEGYRAGVMAQSCAAVKAVLGLRLLKSSQLAHAIVVSHQATAIAVDGTLVKHIFDVPRALRFAWKHLGSYHSSGGSSSSTPPWKGVNACLLLVRFAEVTSSCCNVAVKRPAIEIRTADEIGALINSYYPKAGEGPAAGLAQVPTRASGSDSTGSSSGSGDKPAAAAASSKRSANAGKTSSSTATGSGSSGSGSTAAVAAAPNSIRYPMCGPKCDLNLPLDECPLLSAHCRGFGPLLNVVASWQVPDGSIVPGGCLYAPLRPAIKQYVLAQFDAYNSGSPKLEQLGGPRRRTIVPLYLIQGMFQLHNLADRVQQAITALFLDTAAAAQPAQMVPPLVTAAVKEVVKEQVIEKNSPAFEIVIQSGAIAGVLAVALGFLQRNLGIVLRTEQQLFAAIKTCCEQVTAAMPPIADITQQHLDPAVERSVAFNVFQDLHRIASSSSTGDTGGSSSSGGGGSSSNSGSKPLAFAMPKCGLDGAFRAVDCFTGCSARMTECEGVYTRMDAFQSSPFAHAVKDMPAKIAELLKKSPESAAAVQAMMAAACKDSTAAQEADWGKGQALAGLKGLFGKPAAAAPADAAAGAKPVAVKANGFGDVVASSSTAKAPAAAPAAAGGKGSAPSNAPAAAVGEQAAGTAAASAGSGGASKGSAKGAVSSSKSDPTPQELLVEANLKKWYCSPNTFDRDVVQPLPEDSLKLLVKLKLHTTYRNHGWNALHYACASQRVLLAKQLLEAGASACEPEDNIYLQPLHIACIGQIPSSHEFFELVDCTTMADLESYVASGGRAKYKLVQLLLEYDADPDGAAGERSGHPTVSEFQGLRPLHILSWWIGDEGSRVRSMVFGNPFLGKGFLLRRKHGKPSCPSVMLSLACADLELAALGSISLHPFGKLGTLSASDARYTTQPDKQYEAECQAAVEWNMEVVDALMHATAVLDVIMAGAKPDYRAGVLRDTPLMLAAAVGNAAVAVMLLEAGADPEIERPDGARALEIAADAGFPTLGWALLCYGAQALPQWKVSGRPQLLLQDAPSALTHEMLVFNAIQCEHHPWNIRFLERLLADGAEIEHLWPETGETPLLMAIGYSDPEMVQLLVMAGADVNACLQPPGKHTPAVAHLLHNGRVATSKEPDKIEADREILQMLLDAGADLEGWRSSDTDYDLVQTAANMSDLDATLKLVEAGCKWQVPKGQRSIDGSIFYAPEILKCHIPNLKLDHVEGRFRLAQKLGRRKRAAIATALQPWLAPTTTTECKDATLKCLVAAGVTPGQPRSKPAPRSPVPAPRGSVRWHVQRTVVAAQQGSELAAQVSEQDKAARAQAAFEDLDLLLEDDSGETAAPSKAGSKKKKKETAAQKEAKKKERQRALLLEQKRQQREQQRGSGSDSEAEQDSSNSKGAEAEAAPATAAGTGAEGFVTHAVMGADGNLIWMEDVEQPAAVPAAAASMPQQQQQQQQGKEKQQKGKKSKAAQQQQQQQQVRASGSEAAARPAAPTGQPQGAVVGQQQPDMQALMMELVNKMTDQDKAQLSAMPRPQQQHMLQHLLHAYKQQRQQQQQQQATPPAAAAPPTPPKAMQAALKATASQRAASASATGAAVVAAPAAAPAAAQPPASAVAPAAATGVASAAGQGPPAVPVPAAVAVPAVAAVSPQAVPAPAPVPARPAFLPPHLRMSMPAAAPAAAAGGAAIPTGVVVAGAAVGGMTQQPAVVPQSVPQGLQQQQAQGAHLFHQTAPLRQRMVEMAQQHQLQQQQQQQQQPAHHGAAQQQQQHAKGAGPPLPDLPSAMMALLSGSSQQKAAGQAGQAAGASAAAAAHRPAGSKRPPVATSAPKATQVVQQHPQQHQQAHAHPQQKPAPAAMPAPASAASKGAADVAGAAAAAGGAAAGKGPRLCIMCSQRRRNVLLMPCNHMVLCEPCADGLHGQGKLNSCPHCSTPVKQRIRVHQS